MSYSFFINRPVLSTVISIIIVTIGLLALSSLPITQYPKMTPPSVGVSASYPGASAQTLAQTVAAPLEQQLNGLENMLYMHSSSNAQGGMSISITFADNTDVDKAAVDVNNRVQNILGRLPEEVQRSGVHVYKHGSDTLGIVALQSTDGKYDKTYIGNYAILNVIDDLKRVKGVGDAEVMGGVNYAMRIWLHPDKLALYKLTPADILAKIKEQNAQYSVGHFGDAPDNNMGEYTYSVTAKGRLNSVEDFKNIILKLQGSAGPLYLKNVARIELGSEQYMVNTKLNGEDSVPIMISLQTGANALETMELVKAKMKDLAKIFPNGISYSIPFDTTEFVKVSIEEVIYTFIESLLLVVAVVYLFLQNWRATFIPLIAVPISIIGTFSGMYLLGFSLNLLTLFGLVLAIGIVVDDAIIVLENVERLMQEEHLTVKEAAIKSMSEVTTPVIAIVLVLCAVFIPVSFIGGMAGAMYKQFAVTIAISVVNSGIVALTLTPVLCVMLLKDTHKTTNNRFFQNFNIWFTNISIAFSKAVNILLKRVKFGLLMFGGICILGAGLFILLPHALVPSEDQGSIMAFAMLPPGSSLKKTLHVMDQAEKIFQANSAIKNIVSISGLDLFSGGLKSSAGAFFISLKDWKERQSKLEDSRILPKILMPQLGKIQDGFVMPVNPPAVRGLSTTGGVEVYLESRGNGSISDLYKTTQNFITELTKNSAIASARTTFSPNVPQYEISVDRNKAIAMGVSINSIYQTMSATFGNIYVNDFSLYGRNYKVQLQSDAKFRRTPNDLRKIFVKSSNGAMVPLDILVSAKRIVGSDQLQRFNGFYAMRIMAQPATNYSTGDVIKTIENLAHNNLDKNYQIAWAGSSYQELQAGHSSIIAIGAGILMVFLILAAQYENWIVPIVVIFGLPFALTGALLFSFMRGLANDIYFQIGLITLIGLSAKNSILIVEFAMQEHKSGKSIIEAAVSAARLRFRPIIMTSVVFILGAAPLALASGAGAESRHSIGTGVIGGMLFSTVIAIFFVPLFYKIIMKFSEKFFK